MDLMTTENYGSSSDEKEENHQQRGQSGNKSNQRSLHDNKQIRTYQKQSASLEVTNREGNGGSMNGRNHHLLWGSLPLPQKSHGLVSQILNINSCTQFCVAYSLLYRS